MQNAPDAAPPTASSAPTAPVASTPSATATPGAASGAPFALKEGGGSYPMRFGRVYERDHALQVSLASDVDPGCDWPGKGDEAYFSFAVPPGPGGRFFVGAPFGATANGGRRNGGSGFGLGAAGLAFAIEPFELRPGAHVHGTIRTLGEGEGTFDAIVCPGVGAAHLRALPADAPAGPLSGTIGDKPFAAASAVAILDRQSSTYTQISYIDVFAAPAITCANHDAAHADHVRFTDVGGASTTAHLTGSPQPAAGAATLASDTPAKPRYFDATSAWVRFASLSFAAGATIDGVAVVASDPAAASKVQLGGAFKAVVCER